MMTCGILPQAHAERAKAVNLLSNGDFENGLQGWCKDWGWADVDSSMKIADKDDVFAGKGALEMTCSRYGKGRTQSYSKLFTVQEGKAYKITFYARSHGISKLAALLRMQPGPWTIHVREVFKLLPQWQRFEMIGIAKNVPHMDKTGVYFEFTGEGTVWIDNVTVNEIDLPKNKPQDTGNLVSNGSFEVDPNIDTWVHTVREPRTHWDIDATTAAHGKRSIKGAGTISTPWITLRRFVPHTVSLNLKSDKPTRVIVKLMGKRYTVIFQKELEVGTDWKRFSVTGSSKISTDDQYYVLIQNTGPGRTLWVDSVCLAEGDMKEYQPFAPVEASAVVIPDVSKVFNAGDPIEVTFRFSNEAWNAQNTQSEKVPYTWILKDIYGKTEATGKGLATAGIPAETITLKPKKYGMYRIVVQPKGGKPSEDVIAVVYRRENAPNPNSPFAAHFMFQPVPMDIMKKIGITKQRCHWPPVATQWKKVEPKKGVFQFRDDYIAKAKQNGISLFGSLAATPDWAHDGAKPNSSYQTLYPRTPDDWRNYVRRTVGHYKDIREWEIFNEPELDVFYKGTHEQLMELFISAAEEIKKVDSSLKIVGMGNASPKKMLKIYLPLLQKHDALKYLDAISFHLYTPSDSDDYIDRLEELLGGMQALLAKAGYPDIELWDTESGGSLMSFRHAWPTPWDEDGAKEQRSLYYAGEFVKINVAKLSLGVDRIYTYMIEGSPNVEAAFSYTMLDPDRGPRPVISALATLVRFLESAKPLEKMDLGDKILRAFLFRRGNEGVIILWSKKQGYRKTLNMYGIQGLKVYDVMGNEVVLSSGKCTITTQPSILVMPKKQIEEFVKRFH